MSRKGGPAADQPHDSASDPASLRSRLRRERIAARLAMPAESHERASRAIEGHLARLLAVCDPRSIAFCWPMRREFDCRPLVTGLVASGWRACQPIVVEEAAPMHFRQWQPGSPMTADRHGIPIPDTPESPPPDIVLLPLVAFDDAGYRIGYGGGYFDRTLAALSPRPLAIGVGFELARAPTVWPQPHDVRLDLIVTESGVRDFR